MPVSLGAASPFSLDVVLGLVASHRSSRLSSLITSSSILLLLTVLPGDGQGDAASILSGQVMSCYRGSSTPTTPVLRVLDVA